MQPSNTAPPARRGGLAAALRTWVPTMVFNLVLPLITYQVLTGHGAGEVTALLASGVWPVLETVVLLAIRRTWDEFSIFTLILLLLGVVSALGFNSPRLILVKESAITGLFGVALLVSLLAPRPLMFYFGRKFATDGTPESIAWWNGMWQFPGFRHSQRLITIVWGITMLSEALIRIALAYVLSTGTMLVVSSILPYVVFGGLVFWTVTYGRRQGRRAAARQAEEAARQAEANPA
ncbi:membrane protein [Actinoplanes sp. SE50]|uniref:VC0807 family protein n=1 Tax=unclassified Actinoplanes TaxID=2626549 RepID=UPI00023EC489|nr:MULTISPECIES: VC0807 family protein [unclassified Actinoplanes]AEV84660.1 hypothetical protein ACPL_3765 [Actinoplanes sp. SE50/110]ATO83052.1 membrane protein [Actinoplanes sp. SE50]SLM00460.1 membrane protein [Actinoplanes sp. SE50/110]